MVQVRAALRRTPLLTCALALAALIALAHQVAAQQLCEFGEGANVCGFVWSDTNGDGLQDPGEPGLGNVEVTLTDNSNGDTFTAYTDSEGIWSAFVPHGDGAGVTYTISIEIASIGTGVQASPSNNPLGGDITDSDGVDNTAGTSVIVDAFVPDATTTPHFDFGFFTAKAAQPGTGTPGYWKNHPNAWPPSFDTFVVGGQTYSKAQAITWLGRVGKDKTTTMFSSLVPAMLNVAIGNDSSCVSTTIAAANAWMATYGPVGANLPASSPAWAVEGEPLHKFLDSYNNGRECAPHRK
jgi:hypothetical protein